MKSVKRFARMMALAVAVCMLLTLSVFATETGSYWATESSAEGEAYAAVMGSGVVTDGVVEMPYDADALSPEDLQVNEAYVAMYSVNAEKAGVIRIAWVAPGEIEIDGEDWLFRLTADDENVEDPTEGEEPTEAPTEGEEPTEGEDPTEAPTEGEEPTEAPTEGEEPTEAPTEGEESTEAPTEGEDPTEAPAEDGEDATQAPTKPSGNKKPGSNRPGTGDNTNITLLVALSLVCVAGIAAVVTVMVKGKKEGKA